ncbi:MULTISPECIES: hypothetical protein [unclassified Modestobacter]|uniref:hypothetical protein n=1 Tax=unclassified Modestobacter TaxID=2643866 RepID=UPI0022AA4772|nr:MULTISPECIES: hypothetical protein [unclassified Modestobacter]MCZ2823279.1 hypothetical protein [Modestobacter sp. VKM Ac-2981]MCZ2851524.1 hypothetical protein [Modestobacter sp. VKM Ac-2982]
MASRKRKARLRERQGSLDRAARLAATRTRSEEDILKALAVADAKSSRIYRPSYLVFYALIILGALFSVTVATLAIHDHWSAGLTGVALAQRIVESLLVSAWLLVPFLLLALLAFFSAHKGAMRRSAPHDALLWLGIAVGDLDMGCTTGATLDRRARMNRRFEALARVFERIPHHLDPGDPVATQNFEHWAKGIATRLRRFKTLSPLHYPLILKELTRDFAHVLANDWHLVRTVTPAPMPAGPSWRTRILVGAVAVACFIGATILAALDIGSYTLPVITALTAFGVLALARAGLTPSLMSDVREAVEVFRSIRNP